MAKITLDLNRFKASGVYTIEFDSSERIVVTTQTIRLVVGFSRKGPFNAPVFLRDVATSRKVFGAIDSYLEKRGSYFHRALETCLQVAPVFGLNLLPLNNVPVNEGGDAVDYRSFALAANESNGITTKALLSSFFNKERFWFPDESYLQATVDSKPANRGRLFNFVNLGQEVQSIIIRKSDNALQYNISANDYYGRGNVPAFINPDDYVSDYFVDIYIVKGDWTNLDALSKDPFFSKYFDLRGIKSDKFFEFLSLNDVTMTGSFTGTIIPDFVDNNGANQSIDTILNSAVALTGVFCDLNKAMFDDYANSTYKIDMVGNTLINTTDDIIDFLSYNTPIKSLMTFSGSIPNDTAGNGFDPIIQNTDTGVSPIVYVKSYPFGGEKGNFNNVLVIPKPYPSDTTFTVAMYDSLVSTLTTNSLIKTIGTNTVNNSATPNDFVKVANVIDMGSGIEVQLSSPIHSDDYVNESTYIESTTCFSVPVTANTLVVNNYSALAAATGDILLVQAPGYAKYFLVASTTVGLTTSIVVDTAAGTPAGPYWADKWATFGFPADEFASYLQPSDIKVTLFKIGVGAADDLVPDLTLGTNGFGYIALPDMLYSRVTGLGQTETTDSVNEVTLEYLSSGVWTTISGGPWYVLDETGVIPAFDIDNTSGTFKSVRIEDGGSVNPFVLLSPGDLIKVTLPGGQQFYGDVNDVSTNIPTSVYNLEAPTSGNSIASLACYEAYPGSKLAKNISFNLVIDGDRVKYGVGSSQFNYLNVTTDWGRNKETTSKIAYGLRGAKIEQFTTSALQTPVDSNYVDVNNTYDGTTVYDDLNLNTNEIITYSSLAKNISEQIEILSPGVYGGGKNFKLEPVNALKLEVGDYVVNNDINNPLLVRVTAKVKKLDSLTGLPYYEYTVLETPSTETVGGITKITKFTPIQKFCDRYQFTKFSGFSLTEYHLPGSPAQLEKIYGVLENTNLAVTLADKDVISFRYIIDTFNGGLEPRMGPKQYLSRLAMNRQKCLALLNAPSITEFQASTDPRFTELPDPQAGNPKPVLNTAYIADGGNLSIGPSYIWGLPDEGQGAKFIGVFSPNIIIRESSKDVSIPPAADVSNNFIRKFINGEPFGIVAGPRRGVISNPKFVKMEYDYLLKDRENLEPVGINPIVVVKNVGPMIFANQTAYQRTLSAFNNLHVRDLLITVEEAIEEILQNYLFEFNDSTTRLEIRSIVETYLDSVRNAGGVYDYAVIMDDTNNTPAIIDQNFGIIDIGIEPARGIQKFINRITILKTGTISSGGFTAS
jgi:hypothetical protein